MKGIIVFSVIMAYLLLMNVLAYVRFKQDKYRAQHNLHRTPERRLMKYAWLGGALGALVAMRRFRHKTQHARFCIGVPLALLVWLIPTAGISAVFCLRSGAVPVTCFMIHRSWENRHSPTPYVRHYSWVDYNAISPNLTRAVMASEDNLFATHNGFSNRGIQQAWSEYRAGKVRHGGSTISQQTAKNLFTTGRRTWWRKARETWYTVLIETFWSKQRIMEVYLNVIEMGNGIYGAEAASQTYFRHSAKRLSKSESALIAVCLPNPRKYSVTHPGPYVRKRQQQILNLMPKLGKIDLADD
ncbi:MAG: monofunctional biosynthetic peptidoglycan transglycosylase [Paludibacteraceae bacterium]|nr:monofunctional biosynthetic peptidoglycan transglycosylase [Paludibacteraceae bacterium]